MPGLNQQFDYVVSVLTVRDPITFEEILQEEPGDPDNLPDRKFYNNPDGPDYPDNYVTVGDLEFINGSYLYDVGFYQQGNPTPVTGVAEYLGSTESAGNADGLLLRIFFDTNLDISDPANALYFAAGGDPDVDGGQVDIFITTNSTLASDVESSTEPTAIIGYSYDFFGVVPCFLQGTRILTRDGYRPVESLSEGEEVFTVNLGWQPVRWLGRLEINRTWSGRFPSNSYPIQILPHAFGPGLPERSVSVSPGHAIFFRDHLIPAEALVNGETVVRNKQVESIVYYHVLLEKHGVVFSEGLATESYIPSDNIETFINATTFPQDLRDKFVAPIGGYEECYPRIFDGPVVNAARAQLSRNIAAAA